MSLESGNTRDDDENIDPYDYSMCREDGDLTSLAWLQDSNLITNIKKLPHRTSQAFPSSPCLYQNATRKRGKPSCSFTCLIFMAIEESPTRCLPVKGIYDWMIDKFPYFANAPTGWRNTIRHNLSLNNCFKRVLITTSQGNKSCAWCVDKTWRPHLLQKFNRYSTIPSSYLLPPKIKFDTVMEKDKYENDPSKKETYNIASMLINLSQINKKQEKKFLINKRYKLSTPAVSGDHMYSLSDSSAANDDNDRDTTLDTNILWKLDDVKVEVDENLGAIESDISSTNSSIIKSNKSCGIPLLIDAVVQDQLFQHEQQLYVNDEYHNLVYVHNRNNPHEEQQDRLIPVENTGILKQLEIDETSVLEHVRRMEGINALLQLANSSSEQSINNIYKNRH